MAHLNLLPWREIRRAEQQKQYRYLLAGIAAMALLLILMINLIVKSWVEDQNQRNHYLQTEIRKLDRQIAEIRQFKQEKVQLEQRIEVINRLQQSRHLPVQIMNELAQIMGSGVYLTRMDVQEQMVRLEGYSESNNHLANMMREVDRVNWLAEPKLQQIVANEQQELAQKHAFKLELKILTQGRKLQTDEILVVQGDQG